MSEWKPIGTVPREGVYAIVYAPSEMGKPTFEAFVFPNGDYSDPCYDEWAGSGATHWMPLPAPPHNPEKEE